MTTQIEIDYALMAGYAYRTTRDQINWFPAPQGWAPFFPVPDTTTSAIFPVGDSGFEAISFKRGSEIVISYAGTYDKDFSGDIAADVKLAQGVFTTQMLQAAQYYLDVKAANPGATITLTGHSLGGGLASLIAVFFDQNAVTFDQGPFANSARSFNDRDAAATLHQQLLGLGFSALALTGLTSFIAQRQTSGFNIPNEDKVRNIIVAGEMLSVPPGNALDRIGTTSLADTISNTATGASSGDLHSQALLTAFLQSQASNAGQSLNKVTDKLPDLLTLMFDETLFAHRTDTADKNLPEHLVRNEVLPEGNKMVTRFTSDMWKLAQTGGLTMDDAFVYPPYSGQSASNFISKALMAFAMQKYYTETDHSKGLFATVTGGISFVMTDVAPTWNEAKGRHFFESYLDNEFSGLSAADGTATKIQLSKLQEWYVQAGPDGMTANASSLSAFMLGGKGADTLTGGNAADLLLGGAGNDTYNFTGIWGKDTVLDTDGVGTIRIDGQTLGTASGAGKVNQWVLDAGAGQSTLLTVVNDTRSGTGKRLVITKNGDSDNSITINNFDLTKALSSEGYIGLKLDPTKKLAVKESTGTNVWSDTNFTLASLAGQAANLMEGTGKAFTVYLNQAARAGETITLALASLGDKFKAILGDTVVQANGAVLTLAEGQTQITFALVQDGDITANASTQISATYHGTDGNATSNSFGINLQDSGETAQTMNGDQRAQLIGTETQLGTPGSDPKYGTYAWAETSWAPDGALTNGISDPDFSDVLLGTGGNDKISGLGGNDAIDGGAGNDQLDGGAGDDLIGGGLGSDNIRGGDGNDYINSSATLWPPQRSKPTDNWSPWAGKFQTSKTSMSKTACARSMRLAGHKWLGRRMVCASGLCAPVQKKCGSANQKTTSRETV